MRIQLTVQQMDDILLKADAFDRIKSEVEAYIDGEKDVVSFHKGAPGNGVNPGAPLVSGKFPLLTALGNCFGLLAKRIKKTSVALSKRHGKPCDESHATGVNLTEYRKGAGTPR